MEVRYDLRKIGVHHEDDDLDAHEATKFLIKEVETLQDRVAGLRFQINYLNDIIESYKAQVAHMREYEQLVKFISRDYIELSHEKVAWQRDDWRKRCVALQQKVTNDEQA